MAEIIASSEQEDILNEIGEHNNVIGDCVAGSGKTTTVFLICKRYIGKNVLQITYNAQLKLEVRDKMETSNINNLEVHTYHSLAVKYYDSGGREDSVMRRIVQKDIKPRKSIPKFDIVVIDESQDMKDNYYGLVKKLLKDMNYTYNLLILGDKYQGVYKFMGADIRYLTLAHKIWNKEFNHKVLSTSYRLTNEIASFVNEVMLGQPRINTIRSGPPVMYIRQNIFKVHFFLGNYIVENINNGTYKAEDIFILAPSLKGETSPIRSIEQHLVKNNIACFFPTSDDRKLDEDIIQGKVIFSTFHQAKGRERKLVIVFNFDSNYFKYYGKEYNPKLCPETLYVAVTRAKEKLIVVEDNKAKPLEFIKLNHTQIMNLPYVDFKGNTFNTIEVAPTSTINDIHTTSVIDLVKYLKDYHLESLTGFVNSLFTCETEEYYNVPIESKVQFGNNHFEDVSDINGITIPAIYEYKLKGESVVSQFVKENYLKISNTKQHIFLKNGYNRLKDTFERVEDYLYLTTMYVSLSEELYHKLQQFKHYKWLSQEEVDQCIKPLYDHLPKETIFEQDIQYDCNTYTEYGSVFIRGRLDAVAKDTVWELKCVESLTMEHFLQLIIYAYVWKKEYEECNGSKQFKLLNLRTGQIYKLNTTSYLIEEVVKILLDNKYAKKPDITDDEFIDNCLKDIKIPTIKVVENCLFLEE